MNPDKRRALVGGLTALALTVSGGGLLWWSFSDWLRCTGGKNLALDYDRAIELAPDYARALFNRASINLAKRAVDRAIADYDQALRIFPNYPYAFLSRGNAYRAKDDYERAIADYDLAIKLVPEFAEAFSGRQRLSPERRSDAGHRRPERRNPARSG